MGLVPRGEIALLAVAVEVERGEQNAGRMSAMHVCPICSKLERTAAKAWDSEPVCVKCQRVMDAMRAGRTVSDNVIHPDDAWRARMVAAFLTVRQAT